MPVADIPGLRPTSERIRETLFNWLAPTIEGARCLDLFAGTGALGLEALSRGARSADLVESAPVAAAALRENLVRLAADGALVHETDAVRFLDTANRQAAYDVVFLDPPFSDGRYEELCTLLNDRGWLAPGARIYIEQDRKQSLPALPADWQVVKEKTAGNVRYALLVANKPGG